MKATTKALLCLCVLAGTLAAKDQRPPGAADPRGKAWLAKLDGLWRGDASHAFMRMEVKTSHYERHMRLEAWSLGKDYSLVRILEPLKEKGTATLKAGESLSSYLPRTDRVIKLSSGMMGEHWMGSHFTNDDLIQESKLARDYDAWVSFEGMRDGHEVVELDLWPKPDAPVVWGRIKTELRKDLALPIQSTYYDEDLKEVRVMRFSEVKDFGGRQAPAVLRLLPAEAPGEYTELRYEQLDFSPRLEPGYFSLERLRESR